jgi:DNA-binding beta-propeller fold protein YncE
MSRTGDSAASVLSEDEPSVNHLVADDRGAHWVVQGFGGNDGALRGARSGASRATTVVGALTRPRGVALFRDWLYFTDGIGPPDDATNGRVQRAKRGGGRRSILAASLGDPWAVAVDAGGVYFTDRDTVWSLPHAGGVPDVLARTPGLLQHLTTDGRTLYWSDGGGGSVYRRDHETGTVIRVGTELGWIEGIAADAVGAYLVRRDGPSDTATGGVYAIHEDGTELLAPVGDAPHGVAIDASAIYFVTIRGGLGSVRMLCRF